LGATGLAQCSELCWQLRGEAEKRQVPNCKLALQHNVGLGGAVVVGLYRHGYPELRKNVGQTAAPAAGNRKIPGGNSKLKPTPDGFLVSPLMEIFEQAMQEDTENLIEKVRGIYGFKVTNGPNGAEGYWVINAKTGKGKITYNGTEKPDVTFIINDKDVTELIKGEINPQKAFFQGKVKVSGNMGLAMKLVDLQRTAQHRIEELKIKHKL
jgi:sterol carrier protein 2